MSSDTPPGSAPAASSAPAPTTTTTATSSTEKPTPNPRPKGPSRNPSRTTAPDASSTNPATTTNGNGQQTVTQGGAKKGNSKRAKSGQRGGKGSGALTPTTSIGGAVGSQDGKKDQVKEGGGAGGGNKQKAAKTSANATPASNKATQGKPQAQAQKGQVQPSTGNTVSTLSNTSSTDPAPASAPTSAQAQTQPTTKSNNSRRRNNKNGVKSPAPSISQGLGGSKGTNKGSPVTGTGKGGLDNLQQMISALKAIPPVETGRRASTTSASGLPSGPTGTSNPSDSPPSVKAPPPRTTPIVIPVTPSAKLKADAAPFTPSFSPTTSIKTQGQSLNPGLPTGLSVVTPAIGPLPGTSGGGGPNDLPPLSATGRANRLSFGSAQGSITSPPPLSEILQETTTQQAIQAMQTQALLQQYLASGQQLTPEVLQLLSAQQVQVQQQQQANLKLAMQQQAQAHAQALWAQQQQQQQQQHQQQHLQHQQQQERNTSNIPPRFLNQQQRGSLREQPVYEEEALDDSSEVFSPENRPRSRLSASFSGSAAGGDTRRQSVTSPLLDGNQQQQQHQDRHVGVNAGMLAGIAARAHARAGSDLNPMMAEQLALQFQIEQLQEQQRLLLQQQNMGQPNGLSSLSQALMSQQSTQLQGLSNEDQQAAQNRYYLGQVMQNQRMQALLAGQAQAQAQAQAAKSRETQLAVLGAHRMAAAQQDSSNEFILPSLPPAQPQQQEPRQPSHVSAPSYGGGNASSAVPVRQLSDMGPPPAPSAHRRRESGQPIRHRPTNSIIGSFGGFVADVPDNDGPGGTHSRSASRSTGLDSWRFGGAPPAPAGNQALDLNQAQAQLQMLGQFRQTQIGAGGHHKMASFSFPNMLPNLMMASTMAPTSQSIYQQQQAFQLQLQQNQGPGPQRKALFAPYLPQGSLPPLLAAGKLVVGVLRVNKKNRSDAYVATDVLDADIYICGSKDRNRALEGDIVAIELLDVDEVWGSKKEKEEKKRKKEENAAYDLGGIGRAANRKPEKKKDDVEVEGQGMVLFEDEEVTDEQKPAYAGHVVAVVERMSGQLFTGQISVLRPSSAATREKQEAERRDRDGPNADNEPKYKQEPPKIIWFTPTDKRQPLIAIPTSQAPPDFFDRPEAYAHKLFVASIKRWPSSSLHPFGVLIEEIGDIGNLEIETSALLKNCNFATEDFADATLKCLPPMPWSIPDREYEIRRDMRAERVFTVDPPTAKDLDDALSVTAQGDGTFEVGVHIADVSFFVKPNTPLDREARKRAVTAYLVQRAVPMLPPTLSEELCSLVPGVERLAFSVFFQMDSEGNILGKQFRRTVIKSCAKLAYGDAQQIIEGGHLPEDKEISEEHEAGQIESDIVTLQSLAKKLRARRFADGALKIDNVKLSFKLDDAGRPVDCMVHQAREANAMIEEFMLLANVSAAQIIAAGLPEQAILRRHEAPIERRIEGFVDRAKRLGFEFKGVTSTQIQDGFDTIDNPGEKLCLQIMATKAMNRAKYFCAGMLDIAKYSHFALNTPLYTHFTSPIRRYADVLVHRMLDACITSEQPELKFVMERDQVAKCAQHCNAKRDAAKIAQEQSGHLHLCNLIHDLTQKYGPVIREARVVNVLDNAFDVVVADFGIEKRVHADKVPIDNHVYDEHEQVLSLYWSDQDVLSFLADNSDDEHLKRVRATSERRTGVSVREDGDKDGEVVVISAQEEKSKKDPELKFEGLRKSENHRIQDVQELQSLPVIVSADISKSPPILIVYAVNPYATE